MAAFAKANGAYWDWKCKQPSFYECMKAAEALMAAETKRRILRELEIDRGRT